MPTERTEIIDRLRKDILRLQGFKPFNTTAAGPDLGVIRQAFPNGNFPTGAIHEFISRKPEDSAATIGFISGLLSAFMQGGRICLWISMRKNIFPPALKGFCIEPDHIIFVEDLPEKEALWVMEEALKCEGLSAVIAEIPALSFIASRRLQLAVEKTKVTGIILRETININTTACIARWQITALPSIQENGLPGVGYPRWNVELMRIRNGHPGTWETEWKEQRFNVISKEQPAANDGQQQELKYG